VGRCNAGLTAGHSLRLGLEAKHTEIRSNLEFTFDPFDYFDFSLEALSNVAAFTYDEDLTPYVEWISRHNGTTAGGTTVQVVGSGFVVNETTVTLAGVPCATSYEEIGTYRGQHLCEWDGVDCSGLGVDSTGTSLTCLTGVWDYSGDAFDQPVVVTVKGRGSSVSRPTALWSYANLWSSTTTWGGNPPPETGDSVVITHGEYIILDVSPPELYLLTVQVKNDMGNMPITCQ